MPGQIAKKIFLNTLYNYAGSLTLAGISFFTLILLTQHLSLVDFGTYNLVLSTQVFFVLLLSLGLPSILLRFLPEHLAKNDYRGCRTIIAVSVLIILTAGSLASLAAFLCAWKFPALIDTIFMAKYLFWASLIGILRSLVRLFDPIFSALLRQGYKNLLDTLGAAARLTLFILSIRFGFGIPGIIASIGIVDLVLVIAYLTRASWHLRQKESVPPLPISIRRFTSYGIKEYFAKLLSFFWDTRIDAYFITVLLGASSTGLYYFVINIVSMLAEYMPGSVMQPISQVIFARQYAKSENKNELVYLFSLNNKLKAFFAFPAFLCMLAIIDRILEVFFPKYTQSAALFPIMLFFTLFYIFRFPLRSLIAVFEKNQYTLWGSLVILYKIPAMIFLTMRFGLVGAAIATGTSHMIFFLIEWALIRRVISISYPWRSFAVITLNSVIAAGALILVKPHLIDGARVCIAALGAAALYLALSIVFKSFSAHDRKLINSPFKKPLWHF